MESYCKLWSQNRATRQLGTRRLGCWVVRCVIHRPVTCSSARLRICDGQFLGPPSLAYRNRPDLYIHDRAVELTYIRIFTDSKLFNSSRSEIYLSE
jgi:hypothetical protein